MKLFDVSFRQNIMKGILKVLNLLTIKRKMKILLQKWKLESCSHYQRTNCAKED